VLETHRSWLGEDHPGTAASYNNLAVNLNAQGRYGDAQPLLQKALDIRLKALGPDHHDTAFSYGVLARNLNAQGRYGDAQPLYQKALDIRLKVLGPDHPDTAATYNNLATNLQAQGRYGDAQPLHQKALDIRLKVLGPDHPDTAFGYGVLALCLDVQGRYGDAQPLLQKALDIWLKALGPDHPHTAASYNYLAANLDAQGRLAEAVTSGEAAVHGFERSRRALASSGVERAQAAGPDPRSWLALAFARQGRPHPAWTHWEAGLARGLLDDHSARALRPLTPEQVRRERDLEGRLQALDERIGKLASKPRRLEANDRLLEELRRERNTIQGQYGAFQQELEAAYSAFAGQPMELAAIQAALPAYAALVGWVDVRLKGPAPSHHWACLVRPRGEPVWVKINGTGRDRTWTREDAQRTTLLRNTLAEPDSSWRERAAVLAAQRLGPLESHLRGVRRLIVLTSPDLRRIPLEALLAAWPKAPRGLTVSYAPSGTMLAALVKPRSGETAPARLLALGNPAYPEPAPEPTLPPPPDHGIAILAVMENAPAHLAGIRAGDVLLEYNGTMLKTGADLKTVPAEDGAKRVRVTFWRNGEARRIEVAAGTLGIRFHPQRPAAEIILAHRAADEVRETLTRGEALVPLPGTRREVELIAGLFPDGQVTILLGEQATEPSLQELAQSEKLKEFRFIHLGSHGKSNPDVAMSSALFLAPAANRSTDPTVSLETDGRITAEQIVKTWNLDADLVVLSACETGLGRHAEGEGYLGFAQALFVKGARSVVLSLWKVPDHATSLLMIRFYGNLLGKRDGLAKPLPKAEALHEAKEWLRSLTAEQAEAEMKRLKINPAEVTRGERSVAQPDAGPTRPFEHPYHWAGFILVGNPE
jgi:tetratricopeptide (TPR) repeat protein